MADTTETWSYAGFISYSHTGDSVFAARLQRGVERFAKPWNRIRALRLFRDESNLTASPGLWSSIETALTGSEWFVLLVSPEAAASHWCGREVEHWITTRGSADHVLLVLTAGELVWDGTRFDAARSTALPPALADAFSEEPLWIDARWARTTEVYDDHDPRMQRAVVDVAAAIRGLSKDEMVGAAAKEFRRTTLIKRSAQGALATLLVLSVVATVVALGQRHTAVHQKHIAQDQTKVAQTKTAEAVQAAKVAQAGELAALSQIELDTNLADASTLAVAGYQLDANSQTRTALFRAAVGSPHLVTSVDLGEEVTATPIAPSTAAVALGLGSGRVEVWRPGSTTPSTAFSLTRPVTSIAQDPSADVVAASDGSDLMLVAPGFSATDVPLPGGMEVSSLAVTPDGSHVWVHGTSPGGGASAFLDLDITNRSSSFHDSDVPDGGAYEQLAAPDDDELDFLASGAGYWARLAAPSLRPISVGEASFGNHSTAGSAPNGRFFVFTYTDGGNAVQVWRSSDRRDPFLGPAEASAPVPAARAVTVNPAGTKVAVADAGVLYVDGTTLTQVPSTLTELAGTGGVGTTSGLRFLDNQHLVSITGSVLTLWDLSQSDRLGTTRTIALDPGCGACPAPATAVASDGRILTVNGEGTSGILIGSGRNQPFSGGLQVNVFDLPLWDERLTSFVVPTSAVAGGSGGPTPDLDGVTFWPVGGEAPSQVPALADGLDRADDVVLVMADGKVFVQSAADGDIVDSFTTGVRAPVAAAVSPDGTTVAVPDGKHVDLVDVKTHQQVRKIGDDDVTGLAMSDDLVAATDAQGGLVILKVSDGSLVRSFPADASYFGPVVFSPDGKQIARTRVDGSVDLVDLASGVVTGSFEVPGDDIAAKTDLAFSPDSQTVVTVVEGAGVTSLLDVRDLSTDKLVATVCARAVPDLTQAQWDQFAGGVPYTPPDC